MEKALIIGAAGFVGGYLIDFAAESMRWEVIATKLSSENLSTKYAKVFDLDIMNIDDVNSLIARQHPDYIFHLAAQSSVALSWIKPDLTVDVNIKGSLHILEAVRKLNYKPRLLMVGSGEEYGYVKKEELPIREDNVIRPGNIYAITKACQNMLGNIYSKAYGMDIIMVRAFNHIGPGQSELFVVSDFCKQVVECEKGLRVPVIKVGNLDAKRDFTDVRDIVRAYVMLMKYGESGEIYNVGSGRCVPIHDILEKIIDNATVPIQVEVDEQRLRPNDIPIIQADVDKLCRTIGWNPQISLNDTICDMLEYWRINI